MKKGFILFALAICMFNGYSQEKKDKAEKPANVPAAVKKAFAANYPNIVKVNWSIEKPGEYEAEFTKNATAMSALFDTKGIQLETESKIKESELPQGIKTILAKDYKGFKIGNIEKNVVKGKVTYEVVAKKAKKDMELIFDSNSKLLKQSAENED